MAHKVIRQMLDTVLKARQGEFAGYLISGFPKLGLPGLPTRSACAITGNATGENQCQPVTYGPKDHGSDGSLQWRLGRLVEMKSWCVEHFGRWDTLEAQAAFVLFELKRDYASLDHQLHVGVLTLETLTANFCDAYERPDKATEDLGFVPGKGSGPKGRINYAYDTQALLAEGIATRPPAHAAAGSGGAVVVIAAAAAGGVQWLGGSWWMTALILASGALGGFALWRYVQNGLSKKP